MVKKTNVIVLFLLVLCSISVFADVLTDNFNDNSLDTTLWYKQLNSDSGFVDINETNTRLEFFGNYSSQITSDTTAIESKQKINSSLSGYAQTDFKIISYTAGTNDASRIRVQLMDGTSFDDQGDCGVYVTYQLDTNEVYVGHDYPTSTRLSTFDTIDTDTHTIWIGVSRASGSSTYFVAVDGVSITADTQSSACSNPNLNFSVEIFDSNVSSETYFMIDNYEWGSDGQNQSGDICNANSDCLCGKCEGGQCVLRSYREFCSLDACCISGDCNNGLCSKPTLWEGFDYSKDVTIGDDDNTNNLLSLVIMFLISALLVGGSFNAGMGGVGVILGLVSFYVLGFFFAIVGWLSPFILLAMILVLVVAIVFLIMVGGSTS